MVELNINNTEIIEVAEEITYNFQAGDVADLSLSKSNYTSTFRIPRIAQNVKKLEGLGLVGDQSTIPYRVNDAVVTDSQNPLYRGTLVVLKTSESYEATVISGTKDIFSLMGEQTFGDIFQVRDILPDKTPTSVVYYCDYDANANVAFILGNYGGVSHVLKDSNIQVNADCLAVSYKVNFLWNAVFSHIGVSNIIENFNPSDINDMFLTFPYPPYPEVVSLGALAFRGYIPEYVNSMPSGAIPSGWKVWTNTTPIDFYASGWNLVCLTAGTYIIDIPNFMSQEGFGTNIAPVDVAIIKDGVEIARFRSQLYGTANSDSSLYRGIHNFNSGSQLSIEVYRIDGRVSNGLFSIANTEININRSLFDDDAKKKILNVKLKDFVKEFMYRFSLMGFYEDGLIIFTKIGNIINSDPIDWTDKFIERTGKTYDIGYAQNNWLRHNYINEGAEYYDRNVQSNNMNLAPSKPIITSSFYAPSLNYFIYPLGTTSSNFINSQLFETFTADDKGKVKTENRNFWIRGIRTYVNYIQIASQTMSENSFDFNLEIFAPQYQDGFNQTNDWTYITSFLTNTRVITVELKLSIIDISNLNLRRVYFFQQESAFFMLTKLQFTKGQKAIGEFVRVLR